ncbi:unnamed protein product [Spirodela intermedia]|uniref:Uncharacterized protein n=1 Tax=Spirodela intermedia TaxID=51605 RepID=A0ABN7E932_SPIIN|nr:unnamed protein product [Spirodela intermedia]
MRGPPPSNSSPSGDSRRRARSRRFSAPPVFFCFSLRVHKKKLTLILFSSCRIF